MYRCMHVSAYDASWSSSLLFWYLCVCVSVRFNVNLEEVKIITGQTVWIGTRNQESPEVSFKPTRSAKFLLWCTKQRSLRNIIESSTPSLKPCSSPKQVARMVNACIILRQTFKTFGGEVRRGRVKGKRIRMHSVCRNVTSWTSATLASSFAAHFAL